MRDSNRLDDLYDRLKEAHKKLPDWRFSQLIINFQRWMAVKHGVRDVFYIEDAKLTAYMNEYISDITNSN